MNKHIAMSLIKVTVSSATDPLALHLPPRQVLNLLGYCSSPSPLSLLALALLGEVRAGVCSPDSCLFLSRNAQGLSSSRRGRDPSWTPSRGLTA